MMQSVVGNSTRVMIDQKAGNSQLYLPLDRLIQQGGPAPATPESAPARPQASSVPAEPALPPDASRSREALRNRDRGADVR